jgi:hypothetical protein
MDKVQKYNSFKIMIGYLQWESPLGKPKILIDNLELPSFRVCTVSVIKFCVFLFENVLLKRT